MKDVYSSFINSHSCKGVDKYPGIYGLVSSMSFGGCGLSDITDRIKEIKSLSASGLYLMGVNSVTFPFIMIGIQKSIIYGGMRYTDELIKLAETVLVNNNVTDYGWVDFYKELYQQLRDVAYGIISKEFYPEIIISISDRIKCEGKDGIYMCKVIATLGDLAKYKEVEFSGTERGISLYHAIDKDLDYVSRKFKFASKLDEYEKALNKDKTSLISYYLTGKFLKEPYNEYVDEKRVIPVLHLLNKKH